MSQLYIMGSGNYVIISERLRMLSGSKQRSWIHVRVGDR